MIEIEYLCCHFFQPLHRGIIVCKFDMKKTTFWLLHIYLNASQYIVLYFLYTCSTSVLSFYIYVVLTLILFFFKTFAAAAMSCGWGINQLTIAGNNFYYSHISCPLWPVNKAKCNAEWTQMLHHGLKKTRHDVCLQIGYCIICNYCDN